MRGGEYFVSKSELLEYLRENSDDISYVYTGDLANDILTDLPSPIPQKMIDTLINNIRILEIKYDFRCRVGATGQEFQRVEQEEISQNVYLLSNVVFPDVWHDRQNTNLTVNDLYLSLRSILASPSIDIAKKRASALHKAVSLANKLSDSEVREISCFTLTYFGGILPTKINFSAEMLAIHKVLQSADRLDAFFTNLQFVFTPTQHYGPKHGHPIPQNDLLKILEVTLDLTQKYSKTPEGKYPYNLLTIAEGTLTTLVGASSLTTTDTAIGTYLRVINSSPNRNYLSLEEVLDIPQVFKTVFGFWDHAFASKLPKSILSWILHDQQPMTLLFSVTPFQKWKALIQEHYFRPDTYNGCCAGSLDLIPTLDETVTESQVQGLWKTLLRPKYQTLTEYILSGKIDAFMPLFIWEFIRNPRYESTLDSFIKALKGQYDYERERPENMTPEQARQYDLFVQNSIQDPLYFIRHGLQASSRSWAPVGELPVPTIMPELPEEYWTYIPKTSEDLHRMGAYQANCIGSKTTYLQATSGFLFHFGTGAFKDGVTVALGIDTLCPLDLAHACQGYHNRPPTNEEWSLIHNFPRGPTVQAKSTISAPWDWDTIAAKPNPLNPHRTGNGEDWDTVQTNAMIAHYLLYVIP